MRTTLEHINVVRLDDQIVVPGTAAITSVACLA
jgi:hypothetical protein